MAKLTVACVRKHKWVRKCDSEKPMCEVDISAGYFDYQSQTDSLNVPKAMPLEVHSHKHWQLKDQITYKKSFATLKHFIY